MANHIPSTTAIDGKLDTIADNLKAAVSQGADKITALKDRALELKSDASERANDAYDRTVSLIKAHPIKAVLIAFGVGYVAMRIFR